MSIKRIKLRGGPLADLNSITLSDREVGITTDTEEMFYGFNSSNVNLLEKNHVYTPINYLRKQSAIPFFTRISGTGTVAYDATASAIGTGCFLFTGNGDYLLDRFYAVSPLFGIGGHAAFARASTNNLTISVGVKFYNSSFVEIVATAAQNQFIVNNITTTGTTFLGSSNHLIGEGTGSNQMPVGTRYIKPFIKISSNTTGGRIDALQIYPNSFALRALYT